MHNEIERRNSATRIAREATAHIACTCGAWTTVAPAWHEGWCERERAEWRAFTNALAEMDRQNRSAQ
jgi:hypothetical protein